MNWWVECIPSWTRTLIFFPNGYPNGDTPPGEVFDLHEDYRNPIFECAVTDLDGFGETFNMPKNWTLL